MKIVLILVLICVISSSSAQTSFIEQCPPTDNYCEGSNDYDPGCFDQVEVVDHDNDGNNYTYIQQVDTCPAGSKCCYEGCTNICKEPVYQKAFCPDRQPVTEPSHVGGLIGYDMQPCQNDSDCDYNICCPGFCNLPQICTYGDYKRARCPQEYYDVYDYWNKDEPQPCTNHTDCIDKDQLCCELFVNKEGTYCSDPEYVSSGYAVPIMVG